MASDFEARTTSIELKVIEECTEEPTDNINQEGTIVQKAGENIEGYCGRESENLQLENKDPKTDSATAEGIAFIPKRKFSLRKKSRVEFRVKPDVRQENVGLGTADKLNAERLSPAQARRTRQRQSFSGIVKEIKLSQKQSILRYHH